MNTLPARNLLATGAVLSTACHLQHGGNASTSFCSKRKSGLSEHISQLNRLACKRERQLRNRFSEAKIFRAQPGLSQKKRHFWRTTSLLLTLCWCLTQEVKQGEVTCHLMHSDFSIASYYTCT
jgi:hypothetical protein